MARKTCAIQIVLLIAAAASGCATLSARDTPPAPSYALNPGPEGAFHEIERAIRERHGADRSAFLLLLRNEDALRWRLALIDSAQASLDLQYHVWFADSEVGGALLKERAIAAADRGVRVRVLIDDIELDDKGPELASLDAQPNIEMRIFNPWRTREVGRVGRSLEWISRMNRLNYRMHNKLLIADGQLAIVGGRNIGDHYFGFADDFVFHDIDVLAGGPVARDASTVFDEYWNSEWTMPGSAFGRPWSEKRWKAEGIETRMLLEDSEKLQRFGLEPQDWSPYLDALADRMEPGLARIAYDRPEPEAPTADAYRALENLLRTAQREILVANAYLIPTPDQIEGLRRTVERGVRVRVLTNSLGSNDVPVVNSAYRLSRRDLVLAGADLYELKHDAELLQLQATPPAQPGILTLHMKAFVVDRERLYVGSLNLDPRSMNINTEKAVIIESPRLAETLARAIELSMQPSNAWSVQLDDKKQLIWVSGAERTDIQPARDVMQLVTDDLLSILPLPQDQL